nr:MAG TPA: hypothetical protein [Caudoviricetes sp.]
MIFSRAKKDMAYNLRGISFSGVVLINTKNTSTRISE